VAQCKQINIEAGPKGVNQKLYNITGAADRSCQGPDKCKPNIHPNRFSHYSDT